MSTVNIAYAASVSATCTVTSKATGSARESTVIDNGTNKYLDALLYLQIKLQNTSIGADKAIYVWFYGSEDGTNYDANATGSDADITLRSPNGLKGPFVIPAPTTNLTYKAVIPVAQFFGGVLPRKWGFVVENQTNVTFSATGGDHAFSYTGITKTVA